MKVHAKVVGITLTGLAAVLILAGCPAPETDALADVPSVVRASDERDERGWQAQIVITIENGDIVAVDYDEFDEEGMRKSLDEGYAERWADQDPDMHPALAFKQLEAQLVDGDAVEEVDVVTGATGSSDRFKEVAEEAISL